MRLFQVQKALLNLSLLMHWLVSHVCILPHCGYSGRWRGAKQWRCHPACALRERPSEDDLSLAVKEESGFVVSEHLAVLHRKLRGCH